ncbi:hypothetical protein [Lichenihabitans psoromatis]|uniref:hypothetical protein n=1 Tax=Lichenihabitans psoromatis TaxID=2528642 RepID=UPI001038461C|nr:hypothetical protein [Lichenihabitans psoromatis]
MQLTIQRSFGARFGTGAPMRAAPRCFIWRPHSPILCRLQFLLWYPIPAVAFAALWSRFSENGRIRIAFQRYWL